MPCCMLGAMIVGQMLAFFERTRRLFGWHSADSTARPFRVSRWKRWLLATLAVEILAFSAFATAVAHSWQAHGEHLRTALHEIESGVAARCGAAAVSMPSERVESTSATR